MEFSRQEYRSGLPFPSPRDPPGPGIEPVSPALQADALLSEPAGKPMKEQVKVKQQEKNDSRGQCDSELASQKQRKKTVEWHMVVVV